MVSFERDHPLRDPQRNTRGKPLDPRTAEESQLFGNSTGVQELLTTWCASCSAQPLLRIWYENSCEFCPKPRRRAAAAARSRSSRKPHPAWYAVLCAARAAPSPQGRAMAGQGRSPCGLGGIERGLFFRQEPPPFTTLPKAASNRHRRGDENTAGGLSLVRRLP